MTQKEVFQNIFTSKIKRPGAPELLQWLEEETDFFTAPASTKYHGAYAGGLLNHSLNVYDELKRAVLAGWYPKALLFEMGFGIEEMEEAVAICGLLHDVCKVNVYHGKVVESGMLEGGVSYVRYDGYEFRDSFPLGHGEKSLYLISKFIRLRDEEALAIRWHMGPYDEAARGEGRTLTAAMAHSPLVYELYAADMRATLAEDRHEREERDGQ